MEKVLVTGTKRLYRSRPIYNTCQLLTAWMESTYKPSQIGTLITTIQDTSVAEEDSWLDYQPILEHMGMDIFLGLLSHMKHITEFLLKKQIEYTTSTKTNLMIAKKTYNSYQRVNTAKPMHGYVERMSKKYASLAVSSLKSLREGLMTHLQENVDDSAHRNAIIPLKEVITINKTYLMD